MIKNTLGLLTLTACLFSCKQKDNLLPDLTITSMIPVSGPKATVITLTGTGFSQNIAENIVILNDKPCEVSLATATSLTVIIPVKAGSGNLVVKVNGKSIQSPPFEYLLSQTVSTLAGSTAGYLDGTGTNAKFQTLFGLVLDGSGNLLATEILNNKIRKISSSGIVSTFATGNGSLRGLTFDKDGNLFVSDNHKIFKITPTGQVSAFVGSTPGFADGTGTAAQFFEPVGLAFDTNGNLFVVDLFNNRIRKVTPAGEVTTFAGSTAGFADGSSTQALFREPQNLAFDKNGNLYVADGGNHRIRKITPAGIVTTFAGSTQGSADGTATQAQFSFPRNLIFDKDDNLFVADYANDRIRKITPQGLVSTFAGSTSGYQDGSISEAKFQFPNGLAIKSDGTLFIADVNNNRIRKIVTE